MGKLINKLIAHEAKQIAKKAVRATIIGAHEYMEDTQAADAQVRRSTYEHNIAISKTDSSDRQCYYVTDPQLRRLYIIDEPKIRFSRKKLFLYDTNKKEIGYILKNNEDYSYGDKKYGSFTLYLGESKIGTMTRKSLVKQNYTILPNEWTIEGSLIKHNFKTFDRNGNLIIECTDVYGGNFSSLLRFDAKEYEIIALLIFMVNKLDTVENHN